MSGNPERQIFVLGRGPRLFEVVGHLHAAGFSVTLPGELADGGRLAEAGFLLLLVDLEGVEELEAMAQRAQQIGRPWLILCGPGAVAELTTEAYRLGALAVLPAAASIELVQQAIERALHSLRPLPKRADAEKTARRRYRAGDTIALAENELLLVIEGVVAQFALHEDGVEGLLGLWGPEQVLGGHPEDACCLSLRAHTATVVEVGRWHDLARRQEVADRLRQRILRLEAWSSMQSRQNMELRLLGILLLLAEQFGRPAAGGTLIDVKVTHSQLAMAIGATRATVTRIVGVLRRRGALKTVVVAQGERFCLLPQPGCVGHAHVHVPRTGGLVHGAPADPRPPREGGRGSRSGERGV